MTTQTEIISLKDPWVVPTEYWHQLDDGRIQCDLCPRFCKLKEGQRGLCFVRACVDRLNSQPVTVLRSNLACRLLLLKVGI